MTEDGGTRRVETPVPAGVPAALSEPARLDLASGGSYRRLTSNSDFRRLWLSQGVSGVGDWLVVGLLIPLVTQLSNNSPAAVAGIMIAKIIPSLLLSSVIGVVIDRFDRKQVLIWCEAVNGVLCLGLLLTNSLFLIYAIVFVMEIFNLMYGPAKNALIPLMVEERDLAAANGLSYTTQQASMLIGLTMSGAIVSAWVAIVTWVQQGGIWLLSEAARNAPYLIGPRAGVLIDSASFFLGAAVISGIATKTPDRRMRTFDLRLIGRDVIESFNLLRRERELRGFLTTIFLAILGGGAIISVGLTYVQENLVGAVPFLDQIEGLDRLASQSPQVFMLVFMAAGTAAGAFIVPRFAARFPLETLFVAGVGGFGLAMVGFSSVGIYAVAALFGMAAGFMLAQVTVAGNTFVAERVPDERRGGVFVALESVLRVSLLLSMVVTAPVGELVGGFVRRWAEINHIVPATIVLTGSRITLWFASAIVLGAAAYATYAIDWRRRGAGRAAVEEGEGGTDG